MKTKIFCDIADLDIIRKFNKKSSRVLQQIKLNEKSRCKRLSILL